MALLRRPGFANRLLAVLLCWGVMTCVPGLAMAGRIALVVGNARYEHIPALATPAGDTRAVAEVLRRLGFEVTLLTDVSTDMFNVVLDAFAKDAKEADAVLFYYAGHAFQDGGVNRLVPVSAQPDQAGGLTGKTWSLDDIAARIGGSGTTLIFLDACRTNPLPAATRGTDAVAQGLAEFDTEAGTFVSFSTRPGAVSFDQGPGDYSPFAQAFLDHVERPGQSISDLMINVRNDVEVATVGRQVPWDQSSLRAQFYFAGPDAAGNAAAVSNDVVAPEDDPAVLALMLNAVTDDPLQLGGSTDAQSGAVSDDEPAVTGAPAPEAVDLPAATAPVTASGGVAIRLAATADARPAIAAIDRGTAARAGAPVTATRSAPQSRLTTVTAAEAAPRVAGTVVSGQALWATVPSPGEALAVVPLPDALPRAVQEELKRVGCYRLAVDGDWGAGSRTAVRRYYDARKVALTDADLEPTEALWRGLTGETGQVCAAPPPQPVVAKKAPQKAKPAAKAAPRKAAAKQPAAPEPAKRKPKCTFVVVAIVCK